MSNKTPAMILQELSIKLTRSSPVFTPIPIVQGSHENEFWCKVEVLGIDATGKGRTKKEAKQESARKALAILKDKGLYEVDGSLPGSQFKATDDFEENELKKVANYKGDLKEICFHHNLPPPEFTEISAVGPPHAREFTYECSIGDSIKTRAIANTKKLARQIVAKDMVEKLNEIIPDVQDIIKDQQVKLWEVDQAAMDAYSEKTILGKNLGIQVQNYNKSLLELMQKLDVNFSDLEEYFEKSHTEENLSSLLVKLNLTFEKEKVEGNNVITVFIIVSTDWMMTTMGQNIQEQLAEQEAIDRMFEVLKTFAS